MNQFRQVRLQLALPSKALDHYSEPFKRLAESLEQHGHPPVSLFFMDNVKAEAERVESYLPSLQRGVKHIAPPSAAGLSPAKLPNPYPVYVCTSFEDINQVCSSIKIAWQRDRTRDPDKHEQRICGFDTEHTPAMVAGGARGRTALIGMAFEDACYLFQVDCTTLCTRKGRES